MTDPVTIIDRELARGNRGNRTNRANKAHKTYILNARKVVEFLRAHPGATNEEIREATGHSPMRLQRMGMAKWRREGDRVGWYLVSDVARPPKEKKAQEDDEQEVKWVRYTNT